MQQPYTLSARRIEAMQQVDRMSPALRPCVHEFGLPIVTALTKHGITDPQHIREVVREVWTGARQEGQRTGALQAADALLVGTAGQVSLAALQRFLADNNFAIVPVEPTRAMLDASMAEVSGFNVHVTKEEKHRRRLRAAMRAGMNSMLKRGAA